MSIYRRFVFGWKFFRFYSPKIGVGCNTAIQRNKTTGFDVQDEINDYAKDVPLFYIYVISIEEFYASKNYNLSFFYVQNLSFISVMTP